MRKISLALQRRYLKFAAVFLPLFMFSLLTACASHYQNLDTVDTTNIAELERIRVVPLRSSARRTELGYLRKKILKDTALSMGAQGGLAWASEKMDIQLKKDGNYLDSIYNFNGMMLTHGVIPPVLVEGDFTLNLADPNTIRVSDRTYKIVKQARFATTAPNWREYLWLSYAKPPLPNRSLLPKNDLEQGVWQEYINIGWEKGIAQAYNIFHQNLALLKRDFRGMILYRKLLQQKMVSAPFVMRTELGVTGDGSNMNINDQVLRIVELPQLQTNSRRWRAIVVKQ